MNIVPLTPITNPVYSTEKYIFDSTNIQFAPTIVASNQQFATFNTNIAYWQSIQLRNSSTVAAYFSFRYQSQEVYFCMLMPNEVRNLRFPVPIDSVYGALTFYPPLLNSSPFNGFVGEIEIFTSNVPVIDSGSIQLEHNRFSGTIHWTMVLNQLYDFNQLLQSFNPTFNWALNGAGAPVASPVNVGIGCFTDVSVMGVSATAGTLASFSVSGGRATPDITNSPNYSEGTSIWTIPPGMLVPIAKNVRAITQTGGTTNTVTCAASFDMEIINLGLAIPTINPAQGKTT